MNPPLSTHTTHIKWHTRLGEAFKAMGPAFIVSVSYLDPGNWATAIEGGARHGYKLLWLVLLSNMVAILLQTLAARLGLVSGMHLAQICRQHYPRPVCLMLWLLNELSVVALDLTMVLGTAIGINMLSGLPLLQCILLTCLDGVVLLLLMPKLGGKRVEAITVGMIAAVLLCIIVDLVICKPPLPAILKGLVPSLDIDSAFTAVSVLGANIMPHSFYLHSALVLSQNDGVRPLRWLCFYTFVDIACALSVAMLINTALLIVAAATFNSTGAAVLTLQDAHNMMEQLLSSWVAPKAFGIALLCAGLMSTFTGTIAGQVISWGFMEVRLSTWLRRLLTRGLALLPAMAMQWVYGDEGTYQLLLLLQVVLALQLPFTLIPLIQATSSKTLMGEFANSRTLAVAAWACSGLIVGTNTLMIMEYVVPHGPGITHIVDPVSILGNLIAMMTADVYQGAIVIGGVAVALGMVALLSWMLANPVGSLSPFKARREEKRLLFFPCLDDGSADTSNPVWEPRTRVFDAQFTGDVVLLPPAMMKFADSPWSGNASKYIQDMVMTVREEEQIDAEETEGDDLGLTNGDVHSNGDNSHVAECSSRTLLIPQGTLVSATDNLDESAVQKRPRIGDTEPHAEDEILFVPLDKTHTTTLGDVVVPPSPTSHTTQMGWSPFADTTWSFPAPSSMTQADAPPPILALPYDWQRAIADQNDLQAAPVLTSGSTQERSEYALQAARQDDVVALPSSTTYDSLLCRPSTAAPPPPSLFDSVARPAAAVLSGRATLQQAASVLSPGTPPDLEHAMAVHSNSMSKGARRSFAQELENCWSRFFDLHGHSVSVDAPAFARHAPTTPAFVYATINKLGGIAGGAWLFNVYFPAAGGVREHEKRMALLMREDLAGNVGDANVCDTYSFAVWSLVRMVQLCQAEPRPELWGKYAFVLNRLQGALQHIPRKSVTAVEIAAALQLAQAAIQNKRGPAGTAAGNVAFPKGKEIIISVFKRYKRVLDETLSSL